jgi:hypothetical protein
VVHLQIVSDGVRVGVWRRMSRRIDFYIALCNNLLVLSHRLIIEAADSGVDRP